MLWIDNVIIAVIFSGALAGMVRGLVSELFSLTGWVVALGIGLSFNREFAILLAVSVANPAVKLALSFSGLLFITLLLVNIIKALLMDGIKNSGLGVFNRFWAMALGAIQGGFIVIVFVLLAGLSPLPSEPWWKNALLIPPFQSFAIYMGELFPNEMTTYIDYR